MKKIRSLAVAGSCLFLLCQCASQDEIRDLSYQIRVVNQKVEEVKSSTVNQLRKRQASSVSRLDEVSEEVLQLKSQLEENAHLATRFREQTKENIASIQGMIRQLQTENNNRAAQLEARLDQIEARVSQLAANLEQMRKARIRAAEERAREAARRAEEARKRTVVAAAVGTNSTGFVRIVADRKKRKVTSEQVVVAQPTAAPQQKKTQTVRKTGSTETAASTQTAPVGDLFSQGMAQFKAGKYKDAYRIFEQVLAENPRGTKAARTLFYMAECLFAQGEYDLAILDYQKVISNHARDPHTPTALLKQGISFEKLTDNETAKIIYKKLIKDYPDTPEAAKARKRLEKL
ncbi:tetratricopeptide repeat protein [Desulfolithobacter sp.]